MKYFYFTALIFLLFIHNSLSAQESEVSMGYNIDRGDNGNMNTYTGFSTDHNVGQISAADKDGFFNASMFVSGTDENGIIQVLDHNQMFNAFIAAAGDDPRSGFIANCDTSGNITASIANRSADGYGIFSTVGPNGFRNFQIDALVGFPNNGTMAIFDNADVNKAGMFVDNMGMGIVYGDLKNFKMQHPTMEDKEIWYASLEGPEAAAYVRGTSTLENGRGVIVLPEHFLHVASLNSVTINLTPISIDSKGLGVIKKDIENGRIEIGELLNGTGHYDFDWEVKAIRKGFENYTIVRDKLEIKEVPLPQIPSQLQSIE